MRAISNIKQALLRTLFLFISLPTVTWAGIKIDNTISIDQLPQDVAFHVFDISVNSGVSRGIKTPQQALDINVDGLIKQ